MVGGAPYWGCQTADGGGARSAAFTPNGSIVRIAVAALSASKRMTAPTRFDGNRIGPARWPRLTLRGRARGANQIVNFWLKSGVRLGPWCRTTVDARLSRSLKLLLAGCALVRSCPDRHGSVYTARSTPGASASATSLKTAQFRHQVLARGRLYLAAFRSGTIMTAPSKAVLRAELEAALANYRGPVKQCPAAPPPEELEILDDEDEADEDIVPGLR